MKLARFLTVAIASALSFGSALADTPLMAPSKMRYASEVPAQEPATWRASTFSKAQAPSLTLLPMAQERIDALRAYNQSPGTKALQIGIDRAVASEAALSSLADGVDWQPVAGGWTAHLEIVSPGAEGLRAALLLENLPDTAEIRVAGNALPDQIYAETVARARTLVDGDGRFWTAITDGERLQMELFVPDADAATAQTLQPRIVTIAHLLVPLNSSDSVAKALGDSDYCEINVACRVGSLGNVFEQTKNAVAKMAFQVPGGTGFCTGTLLNDLDTSTDRLWFYSAHHCISAQSTANTLTTFWQFESPSCSSDSAGPNRQMSGGATLRWSSSGTDALLLELNGTLPDIDIGFAGWDASPLTGAGSTQVAAIHHPQGDIKKYSKGRFQGTSNINISGQQVSDANIVSWSEGTTEGGSSGSGLFTWDANSYYLRGGLAGGGATCSNSGGSIESGNYDGYSRLDLAFPNIRQYIAAEGGGGQPPNNNGPTRDHSGGWYVPTESGWGLVMQQYETNAVLFALWFTFDQQGRRAWYQLLPEWTGTNVASGAVRRPTGPNWGPSFNPSSVTWADAGTFTLNFTSDTRATFTFNVDGVQRTVTLHKL